jgi:hypothetical protein
MSGIGMSTFWCWTVAVLGFLTGVDWAPMAAGEAEIKTAVNRQATARIINLVFNVLPPHMKSRDLSLGQLISANKRTNGARNLVSCTKKKLAGKRLGTWANICMLTVSPLFCYQDALGMETTGQGWIYDLQFLICDFRLGRWPRTRQDQKSQIKKQRA